MKTLQRKEGREEGGIQGGCGLKGPLWPRVQPGHGQAQKRGRTPCSLSPASQAGLAEAGGHAAAGKGQARLEGVVFVFEPGVFVGAGDAASGCGQTLPGVGGRGRPAVGVAGFVHLGSPVPFLQPSG